MIKDIIYATRTPYLSQGIENGHHRGFNHILKISKVKSYIKDGKVGRAIACIQSATMTPQGEDYWYSRY